MNYLDQTFGVEIECYVPEGADGHALARALSARLGETVPFLGYTHRNVETWKVVTDGSLNSSRGLEVVSPKLSGVDGLRKVEVVARAMTDFGCTVSKACGFHVHVGIDVPGQYSCTATSIPLHLFKNLARLYAIYEPVIDRMMPASRRGNGNQWCRSMTLLDRAALESATGFQRLWNACARGGTLDSRYHKLNYSAFGGWLLWQGGYSGGRTHKTVEFRQHSGTLDSLKMTNWISLCLRMVLKARDPELQIAAAVGSAVANQARRGSKAWQVGEMLLRPEGVTGPEICSALGWPSVSIPAQARACGLAFRSVRHGRVVRYFAATTAASPAQADVTINGFCSFIGASDEERAYVEQRARDLSGPVEWAA